MIERRRFLSFCAATIASPLAAAHSRARSAPPGAAMASAAEPPIDAARSGEPPIREAHAVPGAKPDADFALADSIPPGDALAPESPPADVILDDAQIAVFDTLRERLARLQDYVGNGNFNLIGWEQSRRIARQREQIGGFSRAELDFVEQLFYLDARSLGFHGDRVVSELTASVSRKAIVKIPGSGHYLFRGEAADTFDRIRADIGDSIILTSGIRGVVKQTWLFLNKVAAARGDLSKAARSVAPPGYSYHAVGDFDVGKRGFGHANFTERFTATEEYQRLLDLGYVRLRYPQSNPYGVRYEPWHIRIA